MSTAPSLSSSSLNLRLWEPESEPLIIQTPADGLSGEMCLSEFFEAHVLLYCLRKKAARNLEQYRESLQLWELYTGRPAINRISQQHCKQFGDELAKRPGKKSKTVSAGTIHKHCIHVQSVIDRTGPKSRKQPNNADLTDGLIVITKPEISPEQVEDAWELEEIGWYLEACSIATTPEIDGVPPADFWQALGVVAYNAGFRIGTLTKLRFDWIYRERDKKNSAPGWWIKIPAEATKTGVARRFFLNNWALAAIESIRTPRDLIFGWPFAVSWLHYHRRRILAASKIPEARRFGFHAFRKAFATELAELTGDFTVSTALGHRLNNVAQDSYVHRRAMAKAMRQLPQPAFPTDLQGKLDVKLLEAKAAWESDPRGKLFDKFD